MPQTLGKWHNTQELPALAQETRQEPLHLYDCASLAWLMPGANRLTRAITAAILDTQGLLDQRPAFRAQRAHATTGRDGAVRPSNPEQQDAAVVIAHAIALRRETESLCTQAKALCSEAERLCKVRPAPASWSQPTDGEHSSILSTERLCRGAYTPSPRPPASVMIRHHTRSPARAHGSSIFAACDGDRQPAAGDI